MPGSRQIERIPPEGTDDRRRMARVINRALAGRLACVGDADVPAGGGVVAWPDPLVGPLSCVLVMQPWLVSDIAVDQGVVTFTIVAAASAGSLRYAVFG